MREGEGGGRCSGRGREGKIEAKGEDNGWVYCAREEKTGQREEEG